VCQPLVDPERLLSRMSCGKYGRSRAAAKVEGGRPGVRPVPAAAARPVR